MKNNLAFLNEVCPPLARVADQLCQAVQNIVQRCINFFVGGGNVPKSGDTTTTPSSTDAGSTTEGTAEETTPSGGTGYDNSNPKFGGDQSTSSTETSSENSTDKPGDKEGETTPAKS
ncbi:hypothetical protein V9T40_014183 [Parthenolecanium corni]|uniref:Uncharacterized protein n=1 Tax=Parthenolecanium corni TaxID=536013 RepID=A0AAN9TEP7_9HEMI